MVRRRNSPRGAAGDARDQVDPRRVHRGGLVLGRRIGRADSQAFASLGQGTMVPDALLAHVAPLGRVHIGLTGDYVWSVPDPAASFRPLRDVRATFPPLAA